MSATITTTPMQTLIIIPVLLDPLLTPVYTHNHVIGNYIQHKSLYINQKYILICIVLPIDMKLQTTQMWVRFVVNFCFKKTLFMDILKCVEVACKYM